MKQLLGIALILALGLVVSHRWFGKGKLGRLARFYYLTGEEFVLLGLLLGPAGANLIDRDTIASLEPFVGLGLGYIGFVFGMQFCSRELVQVPLSHYRATAVQSLATAVLLGGALAVALRHVAGPEARIAPLVVVLIATALGTSTSFLFLLARNTRIGRSPLFRFMQFSSVVDDLGGVVLFGVAVCALRAGAWGPGAHLAALAWVGVAVAVGALSGGLLLLVARMDLDEREILLFLLGVVLFTGGLATLLRLSPVFTNMLAGVFFCNRCPESHRYHDLLLRVEKPIYLFMLVLAGALWRVWADGLALVLGVYVLFRTAGKWLGGQGAAAVLRVPRSSGAGIGLGQLAQSEMSVAMVVNLMLLYQDDLTCLAVSTALIAVVVNDVASSSFYAHRYGKG
ncbi:MAG: hypothetical protein Kow0092_20110 [Deferrisomatales bacterium]